MNALVDSHLGGGSKNGGGRLQGGGGYLTADMREELHTFLIGAVWEASERFNGRGRLAGWCLWVGHRRLIDFLRKELGSTRYGHERVLKVELRPEMHDTAVWDDYPFENNGRQLDREALSPPAQNQLALLELALETDQNVTAVAKEVGMSNSLDRLRSEATIAGDLRATR